ncbi:hypothetical protein BABINDRAFT_173100 [Babjeviella inositovora NRRL Y-12698]|uniref:NADH:quinone oxidoreductase/Mrp antiporter membrane subunit domain-containing protein n=1 Tax=Babjeviella inositovora NRRL Y-12698 TaxID=984486 RepID=A0A1E3QGX4_9ASCO|nr:uncharacterized protein BABINDRAFT_173100 [Babjeviella inositovora NRRL Y-12698]ODQ76890.1 hypothetical protein BABINDRAFT_173100 [Babjeviella inositovora NRRL Y-12698]
MLIPVLCISTLVQLYACSYIAGDPTQPRFFAYLSLFTLLMVVLLGGDNYGILFIAIKSALSALLLNRVGDSFFVLGLCLIYHTYGTLDYTIINATCEGPTPVSALLHAATMVTAGCYVLIRSSNLLEYSPSALLIVL